MPPREILLRPRKPLLLRIFRSLHSELFLRPLQRAMVAHLPDELLVCPEVSPRNLYTAGVAACAGAVRLLPRLPLCQPQRGGEKAKPVYLHRTPRGHRPRYPANELLHNAFRLARGKGCVLRHPFDNLVRRDLTADDHPWVEEGLPFLVQVFHFLHCIFC